MRASGLELISFMRLDVRMVIHSVKSAESSSILSLELTSYYYISCNLSGFLCNNPAFKHVTELNFAKLSTDLKRFTLFIICNVLFSVEDFMHCFFTKNWENQDSTFDLERYRNFLIDTGKKIFEHLHRNMWMWKYGK